MREPAGRVREWYRRRGMTTVAVAAATLVAVGAVVVARTGQSEREAPPQAALPGTYDRMGATGIVVAAPGQPVRFCPEVGPARRRDGLPMECFGGVLARDVDLAALADRRESTGIVWGDAYLAGAYRDGTLHVDEQAAPRPRVEHRNAKVPCPTPAGGWPAHPPKKGFPGEYDEPGTTAATRYRFRHPGEITHEVGIQVAPHRVVIVVWAMNTKVVERALRPVYGGSLCVVRSRHERRVIVAARNAVDRLVGQYGVSATSGPDIGPAGQPIVTIGYGAPRPEIDRVLAKFPPGLIEPHPWLVPV